MLNKISGSLKVVLWLMVFMLFISPIVSGMVQEHVWDELHPEGSIGNYVPQGDAVALPFKIPSLDSIKEMLSWQVKDRGDKASGISGIVLDGVTLENICDKWGEPSSEFKDKDSEEILQSIWSGVSQTNGGSSEIDFFWEVVVYHSEDGSVSRVEASWSLPEFVAIEAKGASYKI